MAIISCRKHQDSITPSFELTTGINGRINDVWVGEDTLWVCGGRRGEEGMIRYSADQGATWTTCLLLNGKSLYTLERDSSGTFWAGGEFLSIWRSTDGFHWYELWLGDQVPFHEEDRPIIRQFQFPTPESVLFIGGENLGEGVLYQSNDHGGNWIHQFHQHEYRDLALVSGTGVAVGHGEIRHFDGQISTSQPIHLANDFFIGLTAEPDGFTACSTTGKIMFSADGQTWTEVSRASTWSGNEVFTDICSVPDRIVACGTGGTWWEQNAGAWKAYRVWDEPNLYCLFPVGTGFWAGGDNGSLYFFE